MKAQNSDGTDTGTVDSEEIRRFSHIADQWWDEKGKFAPLHSMNPVRIEYIRDKILQHFHSVSPKPQPPLKGIKLLDIGCGGGLIAEPMARLGAEVTAIDAAEKNIAVAKLHAGKTGLDINYLCTTVEDLQQSGRQFFDVILALEILEHVADVNLFIKAGCALLEPGGIIICSTINRTVKSYALAIAGAEYILRLLPIGTHTYTKFLRPSELCHILEANQVDIVELTGMVMNPLTWKWHLNPEDMAVNYLVTGKKILL